MTWELFGLPGSGKTTLASKLVSEHGFTLIKIRNRREILWYNFSYFLKQPFNFLVTLVYILANSRSPKLFYLKLMNCFLVHNAKFEKAQKYGKALVDQGHWQNVISVFDREVSRGELERYLSFLPKSDLLLTIDLPTELRWANLAKRGYRSREDQKETYLKRWEEGSLKNYSLLLDLAEEKKWPVAKVRNEGGRFVLPEKVLEILKVKE